MVFNSGLRWGVQRSGSKEGVPELWDCALWALWHCISGSRVSPVEHTIVTLLDSCCHFGRISNCKWLNVLFDEICWEIPTLNWTGSILLLFDTLIRGVPSAESSRSVRGLGKGVSGKPYPCLCNARRPRLEPRTFRSQAVRLYRLHRARPSSSYASMFLKMLPPCALRYICIYTVSTLIFLKATFGSSFKEVI